MIALFIYSAFDHCTGRRWVSQFRGRSAEHVEIMLVQIYGRGLEIISIEKAAIQ